MAPLAGLAYERCLVRELKVFVKHRTGKEPLKSSKKTRLIATLQLCDSEPDVFRFLDLPPELRNHVYRELLTLRFPTPSAGTWCCSPTVLRVSKQISEEALGILYGDNVYRISIEAMFDDAEPRVYYNTPDRKHSRMTFDPIGLANTRLKLPAHALRFQHIDLSVIIQTVAQTQIHRTTVHGLHVSTNHELCKMASSLASSKALKHLDVRVSGSLDTTQDIREPYNILKPILDLVAVDAKDLSSLVTDADIKHTMLNKAIMKAPQPLDFVEECVKLHWRARDIRVLADMVHWPRERAKDRLIVHMIAMDDALNIREFVTEKHMAEIESCRQNLALCLAGTDVADLIRSSRLRRSTMRRLEKSGAGETS